MSTYKILSQYSKGLISIPVKADSLKQLTNVIVTRYAKQNDLSRGFKGLKELIDFAGGEKNLEVIASTITYANNERYLKTESNAELNNQDLKIIYGYVVTLLNRALNK